MLTDEKALLAFRMANRVMAKAARRRSGPMQGKEEASSRRTDLAAVSARVHTDELARTRKPSSPRSGGRRPTLLPDRRRQDGSLPRAGRLHAGLSPPAESGVRVAGAERADALHAPPAHARPARPRGHADLRPGAGAAATTPDTLGPWPFEIGLWVGRAATPNRMGGKGDHDPQLGAIARQSPSRTTTASRRPIPLEELPVVRRRSSSRTHFSSFPMPNRADWTCAWSA